MAAVLCPPSAIVAPYVGAWIETDILPEKLLSIFVAPYVGAWIETLQLTATLHTKQSLPTWERGLKPDRLRTGSLRPGVAPYVGAWIETYS